MPIRSHLRAHHWIIFVIVVFCRPLVAAPNAGEVDEYDVSKQGTDVLQFFHLYPERIEPGHIGKLRIESQINGVRRSRQVALELIHAVGHPPEYYFPFGINAVSPHNIEAIVSQKGVVKERLRNVFYDPSHRTVALGANYEFLPKIVHSDEGTIIHLFAGPFRKGMTQTQRIQALRNYQQTNYILFRFL
jgi:hypothetical protein